MPFMTISKKISNMSTKLVKLGSQKGFEHSIFAKLHAGLRFGFKAERRPPAGLFVAGVSLAA
jgi:hypothetical protein